jgi:membrane protein YqaA with SNARE-associated domain
MTQPTLKAKTDWKLAAARIGMVVFLVAITGLFYLIRDQVETLRAFGYPGIFLINLIASGSIILPIPALPFVFAMGVAKNVYDPLWIGVASGLGATLGELSGYGAGFSGQGLMENIPMYQRLHDWTDRYGILTIIVLAIIPNPIFDMAGIAAGTLRMPLWKFLVATLIGKLIKMWLVAYAGAGAAGLEWVAQFMAR